MAQKYNFVGVLPTRKQVIMRFVYKKYGLHHNTVQYFNLCEQFLIP